MSRLFNDASSEYLEYAGADITAVPLTIAAWSYADDSSVDKCLCALSASTGSGDYFMLMIDASHNAIARTAASGSSGSATSGAGGTINTWRHCCAVFSATNSRAAYLDGGSKGTNTSDRTPSGINRTTVGRLTKGTPDFYMSGRIAEVGIWNAALTDAEVASLGKGASPLLVRPESLVHYFPIVGKYSPEIDFTGARNLTATGTTAADHCRVYYPHRRTQKTAAASSGTVSKSASDTPTVSLTESKTLAASSSRTDTPTVSISETSTNLLSSSRTDTPTVLVSETSAVTVVISASDTPTVSVSEASTNALSSTRADTPTVSLAETSTSLASSSRSDTPTVSVLDASAVAVVVSATDTPTVSVSETASIVASSSSRQGGYWQEYVPRFKLKKKKKKKKEALWDTIARHVKRPDTIEIDRAESPPPSPPPVEVTTGTVMLPIARVAEVAKALQPFYDYSQTKVISDEITELRLRLKREQVERFKALQKMVKINALESIKLAREAEEEELLEMLVMVGEI